MFAQTTTLFALFSLAAQVAVATPPACLIAAVNTQPNPSALKQVCSGSNATAVEHYICQNCGDNIKTAMSDFASVCSGAGVTIDDSTSCSNSTTSSSSSSSASMTATNTGSYGTAISSGLSTATAGAYSSNGTFSSSAPTATSGSTSGSSSGGSGSGSSANYSGASASSTAVASNTAAVARLGMDVVGMLALGVFGAMLAL